MKKIIVYLAIALSLALIITNVYLIEKAHSKVDRNSFVSDWKPIKTGNLQNTLEKTASLASAEESYVYFDSSFGTFQEFLVKEGDEVSAGNDLYTYEAEDTLRQEQVLESEIEQLEDEIDSIKSNISDLRSLKPSASSTRIPRISSTEEFPPDESLEASALEIDYFVEQEIAAKELEIDRMENKADNYERQLNDLRSYEKTVTVQSELDGIVKMVSRDLDNPLIVIASTSPVVQGELTEQEILEVIEGQEAFIRSTAVKDKLNGFVTDIAALPSENTTEDGESSYPFKVEFGEDQEIEKLRPGFHVSLSIVTEEAKDVLTVPEESLLKNGAKKFLLIVTDDGKLKKREVTTGMKSDGKVEVQTGIKKGEVFVVDPGKMDLPGSTLVTPVNFDRLTNSAIKNADKHTILENILLGILERK
ncbi:efflux RND transporter periplasmic adaptor subunit [Bacillus salacetis]|uniref:efflux RND transporter periplasmic adaptor subunit n=1 Tax=Bacillus salacetis TaxID=2315464 RepID=UPI003B9E9826